MSFRTGDEAYDDERLIRYLVGSLDDEESERFDELSVADDSFATQLRAVEDDLVDAYVRGELSADTRDRFESHYLSAPAGRDKIRFAEALLAHLSKGSAFGVDKDERRRAQRSALGGRALHWGPLWAMAAVATLALAVGSYWLVGISRVENPPQPTELPGAAGPIQPTAPAIQPAPVVDAPVLSFVLLPSPRGVTEPPTLAILPGTTKVTVQVVLESDDFPRYQITLKDPGTDRTLWRSARINATSSGSDRIVPVVIEAALLKPHRYVLELAGYRATDDAELISSYPFRVVLK